MFIQTTGDNIPDIKLPVCSLERIPYIQNITQPNLSESIACDITIQVLAGMLFQHLNTKFQARIHFPKGVSALEAFSSPTVRTLLNICKRVHLLINENEIMGFQGVTLTDEALRAFLELKKAGKLDPCVNNLFRPYDYSKTRACDFECTVYEFIDQNKYVEDNQETLAKLMLKSPFYMFLASKSKECGGTYSIPLLGWGLAEIENNIYFRDIKRIFNKIYFIGTGNLWASTHLTVSGLHSGIEPFLYLFESDSYTKQKTVIQQFGNQ